MLGHTVSRLIELAQSSSMTSRHAAGLIWQKNMKWTATNHSMPAGELVDLAQATRRHYKTKIRGELPHCCHQGANGTRNRECYHLTHKEVIKRRCEKGA